MENEVKEFDCHSFDAKVWANEFCRMFPNMEKETMLGWFANAIMAGYDYKDNEKRIFKGRRIPDRENFLFDDIKEGDYWFNRKCEMWFAACPAKFPTKEFDLVIANLAGRTITVNKDNTISVKEPILVDCSINRRYVVLYQGTLKNGVWESNKDNSISNCSKEKGAPSQEEFDECFEKEILSKLNPSRVMFPYCCGEKQFSNVRLLVNSVTWLFDYDFKITGSGPHFWCNVSVFNTMQNLFTNNDNILELMKNTIKKYFNIKDTTPIVYCTTDFTIVHKLEDKTC